MFSPTKHDICNIFFSQHERSASFQYFSCLCYPSLFNKLQSVKAGSAGVISIKTTTVPKHCWYLLKYDIFNSSLQIFVFLSLNIDHITQQQFYRKIVHLTIIPRGCVLDMRWYIANEARA